MTSRATSGILVGGLLLAGLFLGATGCGRGDIVPVSGCVTLDGQPLEGALVTFQPVHEPNPTVRPASGSVGRTDAEGRYRLRLVEPDREGARVGTHVVTISTGTASADDGAPLQGERAPRTWRDGSQRFVVPAEGTASADFELATAESRRP